MVDGDTHILRLIWDVSPIMATLSQPQLCARQFEIFNRICNSVKNLKELEKEKINTVNIELRLDILRKYWNTFQEDLFIILSRRYEPTEKIDYFTRIATNWLRILEFCSIDAKEFKNIEQLHQIVQQASSTPKLAHIDVQFFLEISPIGLNIRFSQCNNYKRRATVKCRKVAAA